MDERNPPPDRRSFDANRPPVRDERSIRAAVASRWHVGAPMQTSNDAAQHIAGGNRHAARLVSPSRHRARRHARRCRRDGRSRDPRAAAAGCPAAPLSNPFAPWGDDADYQLAPSGDIEDGGASWSLTGGAAASRATRRSASAAGDHQSLRLPGVGSATTARMCIGFEHPSFRFFAKRLGGSQDGSLGVDVVYDDPPAARRGERG